MMHGIDYVTLAVREAAACTGATEERFWALATERCSTLFTWKLRGHPPRVAGRGLCCLARGATAWEALFEARRSFGLPPLS